MLFCNQKVNFILWQSKHIWYRFPCWSTSHSAEHYTPSLFRGPGRRKGPHVGRLGRGGWGPAGLRWRADIYRWRLAVCWDCSGAPDAAHLLSGVLAGVLQPGNVLECPRELAELRMPGLPPRPAEPQPLGGGTQASIGIQGPPGIRRPLRLEGTEPQWTLRTKA